VIHFIAAAAVQQQCRQMGEKILVSLFTLDRAQKQQQPLQIKSNYGNECR
jgi:hypothetical protein